MLTCPGSGLVVRGCESRSDVPGLLGCDDTSTPEQNSTTCYCDTDLCNGTMTPPHNGAVMTSSFGHVITVVALLISVVIGYLL